MTEIDPEKRYKNFDEILTNIYKNGFSDIEFDQVDRKTYQNFVYNLLDVIVSFNESLKMERDISKILERLHTIISVNILEEYIQNVAELLRVFMSHSYTYYINRSIEVQTVKDFYQLLLSLSQRKQQILLDNLHNRLSTIKIVPP